MCSKFLKLLFVLSTLVFLNACESTGSGVVVEAPKVDINCNNSKCTVAGFVDATIVLSLSGCAENQIGFDSKASGTVQLLCSGSACTGTLVSWSPSSIESRSYYICGWIDIDSNGVYSTADAFSEDELFISGSPLTMTNWSVTYSSLRKRP
jgi:hypothetical protein